MDPKLRATNPNVAGDKTTWDEGGELAAQELDGLRNGLAAWRLLLTF
jgi:hypothetical protein